MFSTRQGFYRPEITPTIDSYQFVAGTGNTSNPQSLVFNYTNPTESNLLLCFVRYLANNCNPTTSSATCTYNNVPMTSIGKIGANCVNTIGRVLEVFKYYNPPAGTHSANITVSDSQTIQSQNHVWHVSFSNAGEIGVVSTANVCDTVAPFEAITEIESFKGELAIIFQTWRNSAANIASSTTTTVDDQGISDIWTGGTWNSRCSLTHFTATGNTSSCTTVWTENHGGSVSIGFTIKPV